MAYKLRYFLVVFMIISLTSDVFGYAQHPGAYSSPQYAKKNIQYNQNYNHPRPYSEPEYQRIATQEHEEKNIPNAERSKHHEIDITDYSKQDILSFQNFSSRGHQLDVPQGSYQNVENNDLVEYAGNETQSGRSAGLMETAGNFLNGRGGQMLADIARELISRSTGATSQVLSLNLTNLVILVVLKALILAAGMFGAGAWHQGYARSLDGDSNSAWINEEELALWQGYLHRGETGCLQKAACSDPSLAKRYCGGADLLLTTAKLFENAVPYDQKYEKVLEEVKEAAAWGSAGMKCDLRYKCTKK